MWLILCKDLTDFNRWNDRKEVDVKVKKKLGDNLRIINAADFTDDQLVQEVDKLIEGCTVSTLSAWYHPGSESTLNKSLTDIKHQCQKTDSQDRKFVKELWDRNILLLPYSFQSRGTDWDNFIGTELPDTIKHLKDEISEDILNKITTIWDFALKYYAQQTKKELLSDIFPLYLDCYGLDQVQRSGRESDYRKYLNEVTEEWSNLSEIKQNIVDYIKLFTRYQQDKVTVETLQSSIENLDFYSSDARINLLECRKTLIKDLDKY